MKNYAFIDGQNLYQGLEWQIDYSRFRTYLKDKYKIKKAYYFLGFQEKENALYEKLQEAGFILVFNYKGEHLQSSKKGNIDTNLVFHAMKKLIEDEFDKIVLISGDGDFKMMVDYFIEREKFFKIIAPNKKYCSSLYKRMKNLPKQFFTVLNDNNNIRKKIGYKKGP